MIKHSVLTDEDANILNNGPEIDRKRDQPKPNSIWSTWGLDNNRPALNEEEIKKGIIEEIKADEKRQKAQYKFANWINIAENMDEYSEKYQEGLVDKAWKMTGNVARKTPVIGNMVNAFGNTMDATEKYTQAVENGVTDELNYYYNANVKSDPNAFHNAQDARPEAAASAKDAAVEAGRTVPGTIGNPPLRKIPYPLP